MFEVEEGEVARRAQVSDQLNFASDPVSCGAGGGPEVIGTQVEPLPIHLHNSPPERWTGLQGWWNTEGSLGLLGQVLPQQTLSSKNIKGV